VSVRQLTEIVVIGGWQIMLCFLNPELSFCLLSLGVLIAMFLFTCTVLFVFIFGLSPSNLLHDGMGEVSMGGYLPHISKLFVV
jgi:hypothetical protein